VYIGFGLYKKSTYLRTCWL